MISVIIPTYNRQDTLELVLPSYFSQKNVGEIIIVDDHSNKDYEDIVRRFREKYETPLIYIRNEHNLGAAGSRNVGIRAASHDMILWGEDDAFLKNDYIEVLSRYTSPDKKTAVCGCIFYGLLPFFSNDQIDNIVSDQIKISEEKALFNYRYFEGCYQKKVNKICNIPFGHALILVPKAAYCSVNYFEGYAVNGFREESDAQIQMTKNGYSIYYTSETCCYHFPGNFNKKGGQHGHTRLKYEAYKIINNHIFLQRHFNFLKNTYKLTGNAAGRSFAFVVHTALNDLKILGRKIHKVLVENKKQDNIGMDS